MNGPQDRNWERVFTTTVLGSFGKLACGTSPSLPFGKLGSEDVHVPFLSGSYFFSHPGPFTFFSVRMILEETFALLLVKQLVQPK